LVCGPGRIGIGMRPWAKGRAGLGPRGGGGEGKVRRGWVGEDLVVEGGRVGALDEDLKLKGWVGGRIICREEEPSSRLMTSHFAEKWVGGNVEME